MHFTPKICRNVFLERSLINSTFQLGVEYMTSKLRAFALAAAFTGAATMASAVSIDAFDTPLSAGDATQGSADAMAGESFGMTTLNFTAATPLRAAVSITVNPFLTDVSGNPGNTISIAYSIDGGLAVAIPVTAIVAPPIGAAAASIDLEAGETVSFFVTGTAGQSGNQVTFAVETSEVPLAPAGALALTGVAALAAARRARKNKS